MKERTEKDLRDFAIRFDNENDCPFEEPSEFLKKKPECDFVDGCQQLISFGSSVTGTLDAICARKSESDPERAEKIRQLMETAPPANNIGFAKYGTEFKPGWGGYDGGVECSVFGQWRDSAFVLLSSVLNSARQACDDGDELGSYIEFGGFVWKVWPKGANAGYFKYKWVMESHGIKVYIHSNPLGSIPPVRVRFGFECLARTDLFKAYETLKRAFISEGFQWVRETLSRVDMQVLLPCPIDDFIQAMRGPRVVTVCRGDYQLNANFNTNRIETVTVRSVNIELCIYDKKAQVDQADYVYQGTFQRFILNGETMPDELTRIEFRLKRGALRRYGIDTFEDLKSAQSALPQVVGRDWFRILERDKVRGHENEIKNAPIWDWTLRAFKFYFSGGGVSPDVLRNSRPCPVKLDVKRLMKQAAGLFSSAMAVCSDRVSDLKPIVDFAKQFICDFGEEIFHKIAEKKVKNEVTRGFTPSGHRENDCLDEIQISWVPLTSQIVPLY
ncbi:MAG: hypothetical protein Q4A17_12180 [Thermoguttaceae bacterium]|nr:hypothetical protein [Thermoguttaceae bacterium]